MSTGKAKSLLLLVFGLASVQSFGTALGAPDTSCDPTVDPPSSGGCIWNNFSANTDGSITGGSSFMNYYVNAGDPPWTFTSTGIDVLRILDGGHQGDTFSAFDNGVLLGTTSFTPIDVNHSCANDTTGSGTDPAACWNDPLMSRGTFLLAPGDHSITVTWDQRVPGGNSTLQWFEVATVPEPGSLLLAGSALVGIALLRIRRRRDTRS